MEGNSRCVLLIDEEEKICNTKHLISLNEKLIFITRTEQGFRKLKELGFNDVFKLSNQLLSFEEYDSITKVVVYGCNIEITSHFLEYSQNNIKTPIILITENKRYSDRTYKLLGANLVIFTNSINISPFLK